MENYELSHENIKQIDNVTSQIRELKDELEGKKTEQDTSKTEQDTSKTEQDTSKTEQDTSKTEQDTSKTEQDTSKTEQDTSKREQDTSKREQDTIKTEQDTSKREQDTIKTEQDTSKREQDTSKTEQDTSKTEQDSDEKAQSKELQETDELFYEVNDKNVILKMDVVKDYLEKIKDKEWSDLKSNKPAARIMAVQIALRSPKVGGESHNKYGEIVIDGILGPKTKEAVEKFQTEYGLKVDGLPGKETMNKIYSILTGDVAAGTGTEGSGETGTNNGEKSDGEGSNGESGGESGESVQNVGSSNESSGKNVESVEKEPEDFSIVSIEKYIPSIKLDMRYATSNNFTGQKIYESADAKLRYGTIKKLKAAQDELSKEGYSIKIWDAYRPQSAQKKLWSIRPDPALVADPKKGSAHTKGNTVDITLVKNDGTEISMPSEFDDNNKKKIDRDYADLSDDQRNNAKILENAMKKAGFVGYDKERRHYTDSKDYPMERGD